MSTPLIQATPRIGNKKSDIKQIRSQGNIPGVIYGKSIPSASIVITGSEYRERVEGHSMVQVELAGRQIPAVIQSVTRHPVDRKILHIELHAVSMKEEVHAHVPITLHGLELVEKSGGIIQQQMRETVVVGLAEHIPDLLIAEISHLHIGDLLRLKDVSLPIGITLSENSEEVVASIVAPKATATENPAMPDAVPSAQSI